MFFTNYIYSKIVNYDKKTTLNSIDEIKKSKNRVIKDKYSPKDFNLDYFDFSFESDGLNLKGWIIDNKKDKTLIFVHGRNSNKMFLLRFLNLFIDTNLIEKYNIVMLDFRNSGDSDDSITAFGYFFAKDLKNLIDYVNKEYGYNNFTLYGFSQGAMAVAINTKLYNQFYKDNNIKIEKIVLDSPLANVKETIIDNAKIMKFKIPYFILLPSLIKFNDLVDNNLEKLRLSELLGDYPCLILQSEKDTVTKYSIFKKEYENLINKNKENIFVKVFRNGLHVRMYLIYKWEYTNTVHKFLEME